MYGRGAGQLVGGTTATAAGVAVLPNTAGNPFFVALGFFSLVVGIVILATLLIRSVAKRHYK